MAGAGFDYPAQRDFSAGMFRGVARHLIPGNGLYDAANGLFDDDGSFYRRGGSEYKSNAGLGAAGQRWAWDGQLSPGARTLVASATKFGVLDVDDATILDLGGPGLAGPTRAALVGGLLFIGGGTIYGGSRKATAYSTGTVAKTNASAVLTGTGTAWSANVDAGMLFRVSGERVYVVKSVDSNTQITLTEPYQGATAAGGAYTLKALEAATAPYTTAEIYATIFDRLLVVAGKRMTPSAADDDAGLTRPHLYDVTEFQDFPADILGVEVLRDTALIFTSAGLYAWTGAAFDETDDAGNPQWSFEPVNPDLILWAKEGVATYGNQLIVPCTDGVWSVGVASAPRLLSRSIDPGLYLVYVRLGYKPGRGAVYGNHYLLPILDAANAVVDTLVCRLDRPFQTRVGECFPWGHWDGHGGNVTAFATRVGGVSTARQPVLLGASRAVGSRLLNLSPAFAPDAAHKADADTSVAKWVMETRDVTTGGEGLNMVRGARIRYEMLDGGSDNPRIFAAYSIGAQKAGIPNWGEVDWGGFDWTSAADAEFTALAEPALEDTGRLPKAWAFAVRARFIRLRLTCTDPTASLRMRMIEFSVLPSGRVF